MVTIPAIDGVIALIKTLNSLSLEIGIVGKAASQTYIGTTLNVATVGMWQEYGTEDIAARSFLRSTFAEKKKEILEIWKDGVNDILHERMDPILVFSRMGDLISKMVLDRLDRAEGWAKELAPATVSAKGSSQILVDSGLLRESIGWAVLEDGVIRKEGLAI